MSKTQDKKIVLGFIADTDIYHKENLLTNLVELTEEFSTVPEEVDTAFKRLTTYEFWEVIRLLAVKGKKETKGDAGA